MINEKLRLSVGGSPVQRAVAAAVGMVFAVVGAAFVLLPLVADGFLRRMTGSDEECTFSGDIADLPPDLLPSECLSSGDWDGASGLGAVRFIGVCGIPFVVLGVYLALRTLRAAAWLDGTRVAVRGALRTRVVNLATAEITAGAATYEHDHDNGRNHVVRLPTLVARDPGTGRQVTVPLHGPGLAPLPPHELRSLADAMTLGRPSAGRDADVHTIAGQLRTMAQNPLGL